MDNIDRIALIAGNGKFPIFFANAARLNNVYVIAIAINSETDKEIEKVVDKVYWIDLGNAKLLIDILKKENIRYAVMAGKITKLTLFKQSIKLDEEAKKIITKVMDKRDDTLLSAVASRLKEIDVELIDSTTFLKGGMLERGVLTKRRPTREEQEDITFGFKTAKEIGALDIGQTVAIKKKAVIAVEAIEGTDEMIKRAGDITGPGTVIVKVSKPNQDMRFDVPVVGPGTIQSLKEAKAQVLALEANKVLVLEKEEFIKEADREGISIVAV